MKQVTLGLKSVVLNHIRQVVMLASLLMFKVLRSKLFFEEWDGLNNTGLNGGAYLHCLDG